MAKKVDERVVILGKFARDSSWVSRNTDRLRSKYPDKFIVVHDGKILDSDSDYRKLLERVKKEHKDRRSFVINFIGAEKPSLIL